MWFAFKQIFPLGSRCFGGAFCSKHWFLSLGNWQKKWSIGHDVLLLVTKCGYLKNQIWRLILKVGNVPFICPIFPAPCRQGQVLPPWEGCIWPLITHSLQYNWGCFSKMPLFVQMLEEEESKGTTNRGIISVLAQHAAPSPLKQYLAVSFQGSEWGELHTKFTNDLWSWILWDPPSAPQTQIPHLLWKRHVAL